MFEKTVKEIKAIKIQGARSIVLSALNAFAIETKKIKAKNKKEFFCRALKIAKKLAKARITEPALRNSLAFVLYQIDSCEIENIAELKKLTENFCREKISELEKIHERVAEIASRRIANNAKIFTHCHSTSVVKALLKAKKEGKKISVVCTETRPLFQGLKTARDLSKAKIPVTLIIDSACRTFIKECDIVVLGADVITANGAIVNKIGSAMIATIAKELRKPLIAVASSYKFDPITIEGFFEPIEERSANEISAKRMKGVQIKNPAFDVVAPDRIDVIVTEIGAVSPSEAYHLFSEKFKWFENARGKEILKELMK